MFTLNYEFDLHSLRNCKQCGMLRTQSRKINARCIRYGFVDNSCLLYKKALCSYILSVSMIKTVVTKMVPL